MLRTQTHTLGDSREQLPLDGLQPSLQASFSAFWGLAPKSGKFTGSFLSTWGTQLCVYELTLGLVLPPFSLWV